MVKKLNLINVKAGDEVKPGTVFLGWNALSRRENVDAVECTNCGGYAESAESTKDEIRSDLNCGRPWACCCAAFKCKKCGVRLITNSPAPEMS